MIQALEEIKSYRDPPLPVKRTLVAALILLDLEGVMMFLEDAPTSKVYPNEDMKLWAFAKKSIVLNRHHPLYIMGLIREHSKVDDIPNELKTKVCSIVVPEVLLEDVSLLHFT